MKPQRPIVAPPTPEWTALVVHLQACKICQTSALCDAGRRLVVAHKAARR